MPPLPSQTFTESLGIEVPLICGAMYPCSNPELVAAVSEAGALGIVQPMSLTYVHGHDFRDGLRYIRRLTQKPIGLNLIIERSSRKYLRRAEAWLYIALEEQVPFLVTALGDPGWVVERAQKQGVIVYHDVATRRHAEKAVAAGVDGLICVNNRAGGHTGVFSPQRLLEMVAGFGKPMICAGGIGSPTAFEEALAMGYTGAQLGTRFIATRECRVPERYKRAILDATADDIVLTDRLTGIPVSAIQTPWLENLGSRSGPLTRRLLKNRKTRRWMRTLLALRSVRKLKRSAVEGMNPDDWFLAGKSVGGIAEILPVAEVVERFSAVLPEDRAGPEAG